MKCGECFTELVQKDGYLECPACGWNITDEEAEEFDIDDYRSRVLFPGRAYEEIPEGCAACGGDYPNCKDSCPLFD